MINELKIMIFKEVDQGLPVIISDVYQVHPFIGKKVNNLSPEIYDRFFSKQKVKPKNHCSCRRLIRSFQNHLSMIAWYTDFVQRSKIKVIFVFISKIRGIPIKKPNLHLCIIGVS